MYLMECHEMCIIQTLFHNLVGTFNHLQQLVMNILFLEGGKCLSPCSLHLL
jgi:hypothetical protein